MISLRILPALVIAAASMTAVAPVAAQSVTTAEIQRIQDDVYLAGTDLSRLRGTDSTRAARLQDELDELRDEAVYLKVKLRKEGSVPRAELTDLRGRVQELRAQARGESTGARGGSGDDTFSQISGGAGRPSDNRATDNRPLPDDRRVGEPPSEARSQKSGASRSSIPVGQEIDVRLQTQVTSDTAQVEDRVEATTVVDLYEGDKVIIPAGSEVRGVVAAVNRASRTDRKGSLTLSFDQVTVRGRSYPLRGIVTDTIESEGIKGEAGRIGAGSAVGAIIGGIIGGVKGALIGVLVGGGGTMVATEGQDVTVPAGTILRVRLDTPPDIR